MYLDDEIDNLLQRLKADKALENIEFIKAYPYSFKATRLSHIVAVLSPQKQESNSISVDNMDYYAENQISITLFSPFNLGSPVAMDSMKKIINSAITPEISGIAVENIETDDMTQCFKLKSLLNFGFHCCKENEDG